MSVVMVIDNPHGSQEICERASSGWPVHRCVTGVPA
jgi:hypothetical protein